MSALFRNVLTASFHGSIVIAAVLLLRILLRKAPKKYICYLWLLAGLRLLMPFEIQSDLSLQPKSVPETMIRWEQPAPIRMEFPAQSQELPQSSLPTQAAETVAAPISPDSAAAPALQTQKTTSIPWRALVPFLWIGVALVFIAYSAVGYVHLRRRVRNAVKIPGGWEAAGIDTAFILGFVRPQIYIPVGMSPTTRKHILAHERTHLEKGDHWIKMIGFLALALHWFNPLVWVAYALLCKDIEMACDERVVQFMELSERKEYSTALLNCSTSHIHYAASPVAFGEVSVKNRIQSILNYRKPGFWVGLLSVLAIAFVTVCLVTSPTRQTDAPEALQSSGSTLTEDREFTPATQPPMEENPDWGLSLIAQASSPTTLDLYYGVNVDDIPWDGTPIYKERPYWIEVWNGSTWEELPTKVLFPEYAGSCSVELSMDNLCGYYDHDILDLTLVYGALPEGDYRIVLRPKRNEESQPFYAWFHVYANVLPEEQAQAIETCRTALDALAKQEYYSATISESTPDGALIPSMVITRSNVKSRIDYYYGLYLYGSTYLDTPTSEWLDAFSPTKNQFISFPEGESKISSQEITFLSAWVDSDGVEYKQRNTFTFRASGALEGIDLLTEHTGADGAPTRSRRALELKGSGVGSAAAPDLTPKDTNESQKESPWGIYFRVDDDHLNASAGDIWLGADTVGVSNVTTDGSYWLEKRFDGKWVTLATQGEPSFGSETYHLKSRMSEISQVDWTPYYGTLSSGLYRMGKHFYKGDESIIQYAEFVIYPAGGIKGHSGKAALARVDAALARLVSGNYYMTDETIGGFRPRARLSAGYWKYDGVCVTDYYNVYQDGTYLRSDVTDPDADLFYNAWADSFDWYAERRQVFFDPYYSVISEKEISFATSMTNSTYLARYSFFFDDDGNITQIMCAHNQLYSDFTDLSSADSYTLITVQEKSDEEIKAWVDNVLAESSKI